MNRAAHLAAAVALALAACKSTAPYTVPAALLNTGVAVGASAAQRASGGCFAVCTNGTVCDSRTGLCVRSAGPRDLCEPLPEGGERCVPLDIRELARERQGHVSAPAAPVGVSPATGSTPPAPAEASPRRP